MTREECEKKIAEYCTAIRLTMLEYNPGADYLSITLRKGKNGNDDGDWDTYDVTGNNAYWEEDKERPISFHSFKDIKDEKYWKCVSEQDDREDDEVAAYEGHLLADGSYFYSDGR